MCKHTWLGICECEYPGWLWVSVVPLNGVHVIVGVCLDTMCERDCRYGWVKYEGSRLGMSVGLSIPKYCGCTELGVCINVAAAGWDGCECKCIEVCVYEDGMCVRVWLYQYWVCVWKWVYWNGVCKKENVHLSGSGCECGCN